MSENKLDTTLWLSPLVPDQNFSAEFRDDHIHVTISKDYEVKPDQQNEFWSEISKLCEQYQSRRVLIEGLVPRGELDTAEVIDAGQRTAIVPNLWLAIHLDEFVPSDRSELFEVIAASRGVRVKFFSESATALKWLRNNAPA